MMTVTHIKQSVGLQIHVRTLLLDCPHLVTKRAEEEEMHNKWHVFFKNTYVNVTKNKLNLPSGGLISLFKYSAEGFVMGEVGEEEEEEEGVQGGSGCDVEYSDGGGGIQLTPFLFLFSFLLQAPASSLKHMAREQKEDGGRDWGEEKRRWKKKCVERRKRK